MTTRKIIGILVAAGAAVLMTFAVAVATAGINNRKLDLSSHRYADSAIRAIVSNWNSQALLSRASSGLSHSIRNRSEIASTFDGFRAMGKLESVDTSIGHTVVLSRADRAPLTMAQYTAMARFENGPAQIRMTLIRAGSSWRVVNFGVVPIRDTEIN